MKAGSALMKKKAEFKCLQQYAIKGENGKIAICTASICFANFTNLLTEIGCWKSGKGISEFYLAIGKTIPIADYREEVFNKYLKFIMNESFVKDAFNTKRVCDAKRYGVSLNVDVPANILWVAALAIRRAWEFPEKIRTWDFFCRAGVHPQIALTLCEFFQLTSENLWRFYSGGMFNNHEIFKFNSLVQGLNLLHYPLIGSKESMRKKPTPIDNCIWETTSIDKGLEMKISDKDMREIKKMLRIEIRRLKYSTIEVADIAGIISVAKYVERKVYGT